ncbi:(4Fe-4S)-binding protein [Cohnella silvisoli]|uniref:(4Fe-4S)-binding protein n=1 Tax=Cohnella silvisoli TaxID=2873699 RepID=A0ABV1KTQ3_9BACL|nr:(4Fe-4S)-binding protein [Cohnella silvisoli]MCD9022880.1 (4Fe-4S)-binding protein [Cohnella silvisoli]
MKRYIGSNIDVLFDSEKCIHSGTCVRGLPNVFNVKKKPWVNADGERAEKIAALIETCPSGALQYILKTSEESK